MTSQHVLVVGGPSFPLDKVDSLGLRYSMVQIPELVRERDLSGAVRYAVIDYRKIDEVSAIARAWHGIDPFDAVISFTEYGLYPAARCAAELGIPGDNVEAVVLTRDKRKTRDLLDRHGLSPVRHRTCGDVEEARAFLTELNGAPVVLKPCDGGLSEGVFIVESEHELAQRWAWTRAATSGPVLVEEFLSGPEYSVEAISIDGKHEIVMITEKVTTELPRFVELGHQVPARLTDPDRARIEELVIRLLELVRQKTGPTHTEVRLTPSGPRIIESQTRIGGDQVWELCEMVSGVDLMSEAIAAMVGLPAPERVPVAQAAAIRFFSYENVRILAVDNLAAAAQARGVVRLECSLAAGQEYGDLASSTSRQGYVLCTGATTADAVTNAEAARDLVAVTWEPIAR
ncbi:ATP-grasp domain-containing protein [Micromonospora sp. CPCC 206060]|uniref:ATP-grasp domain-containing protein n=1 Tax=Micromonospora sp. CPCC 206060 TaxID=3122406 RepID=UPI002FEFAF42